MAAEIELAIHVVSRPRKFQRSYADQKEARSEPGLRGLLMLTSKGRALNSAASIAIDATPRAILAVELDLKRQGARHYLSAHAARPRRRGE
jgi:hypothetical protein